MMISDTDIVRFLKLVETRKKVIKFVSLLTGLDIEENFGVAKKVSFLGVFSADHIPETGSDPSAFIVNTAVSRPGPFGEHWLFIFKESAHRLFFVDSFGRPPENFNSYIYDFVSKYGRYFNTTRFQADGSEVCGFYCLFFALITLEGRSVRDGLIELENSGNSDKYVVDYVNKAYFAAEMFMNIGFCIIIICAIFFFFVCKVMITKFVDDEINPDLNYNMRYNYMMDID